MELSIIELAFYGLLLTVGGALAGITIHSHINGDFEMPTVLDRIIFIFICIPVVNLVVGIILVICAILKDLFDTIRKKFKKSTLTIEEYKEQNSN